MNRRTFLFGLGAAGVAGAAAAERLPSPGRIPGVEVDLEAQRLRFTAPVDRGRLRAVLRRYDIPHRWLLPDSVELRDWVIETPSLARGFGWSTVDAEGRVVEAWAELQVLGPVEREFEVSVGRDRLHTDEGLLHFRCDAYPPVRVHDRVGRSASGDHLALLAQDGAVARCHRLVAVA